MQARHGTALGASHCVYVIAVLLRLDGGARLCFWILAVGFPDVQQRSCAEVALGVNLEQNFLVIF
jgi:hypothetical protein